MLAYFGINPPGFVATVALHLDFCCIFFPAIVMGIFSLKMNKEGAVCGIYIGMSLMLIYAKIQIRMVWRRKFFSMVVWNLTQGFGSIAMLFKSFNFITVSKFTKNSRRSSEISSRNKKP